MTTDNASGRAVVEKLETESVATGDSLPVEALLSNSLKERKPLADDGSIYGTIQEAENAASSFVFVPPGTFHESVTLDTTGLTLLGCGRATIIDGGGIDHAIEVTSSDITIESVSVKTTGGAGTNFDGINVFASADGSTIKHCYCGESDDNGITINATDVTVRTCTIENVDSRGIEINAARAKVIGNRVTNDSASSIRIESGDDGIFCNNICKDSGSISIFAGAGDCLIGGNRIMNANLESIKIDGKAGNVVYNNRVSGGTGINDANSNSTLDGNNTATNN